MCGVSGAICESAQAMAGAMCHASSRRPAKRVWLWMRPVIAPVVYGLNLSGPWATSRESRCWSRADLTLVPALHPVRADWEEAALPDWEEVALPDWEEAALPDWEEVALPDWEEVASAVATGANGGKAHWGWPRAAMDRRAQLIGEQASGQPTPKR